jgi:hypothetical protein
MLSSKHVRCQNTIARATALRRLKNKSKIEPLSENLFRALLCRVCQDEKSPCTPQMETYIAGDCYFTH